MRLWLFAFASFVLLAAGSVAEAACQLKYEEFPVTMAGTRPLIAVTIDGVNARMLVDTGAFFSVLSPAEAQELKLPRGPLPFNLRVTGVGGEVAATLATAHEFVVAGKLKLPGEQFIVGGGEAGEGAVGVLGANLWSSFDTEFDLGDGVVRMFRNSGCDRTPLAYWDKAGTYSVMDMVAFDQGGRMISGYGYVNGVRIKVLFDTGASTSNLSYAAARRAHIDPNGPNSAPGGFIMGAGRNLVESRIVPVDMFQLGSEKVEHTRLRLAERLTGDSDMLLGADFFLSHRIYASKAQNKIYFTYSGGAVFNLRPQYAAETPAAAPASASGQTATAAGAGGPVAGAATGGGGSILDAAVEPKDAAGFARRGAAALGRQDYARAIADLTKAHDMAPNEAAYLYQRGVAYRQNRQPFLAIADFDAALKLDPKHVETLIARAEMELAGRQVASAVADLDAADKLLSKEADARFMLAELYSRAEAFAPAGTQFDLWIKAHDDDARLEHALAGRCWSGAMSGDLARAMSACDSALRRSAKDPLALDGRGFVYLRQQALDKAVADFDAALAAEPKIAWALYGRSVAEQRQGKADAAKADLAAAKAIRPRIEDTAKTRGIAA